MEQGGGVRDSPSFFHLQRVGAGQGQGWGGESRALPTYSAHPGSGEFRPVSLDAPASCPAQPQAPSQERLWSRGHPPAEAGRASHAGSDGKWLVGLGEQRVPCAEGSPAIHCQILNFGSGQEAANEADNCLAVSDRESRVSGKGGAGDERQDYVSEGSIFLGFVYAGIQGLF